MSSNEQIDVRTKCGFFCLLEDLHVDADFDVEYRDYPGSYTVKVVELRASRAVFKDLSRRDGHTQCKYLFTCKSAEQAKKAVNRMTKWIAEYHTQRRARREQATEHLSAGQGT